LPIEQREHEWEEGLHPFFQHLAPEGWLRERQARTAQIAEEDDFGLLLRYGRDCIGAVSICPLEGESELPALTEATANPGRTISGIQKKLLVIPAGEGKFRAAGATGSAGFIAKFNSPELPTLVRNEHLSLRWTAAVLGQKEVTEFGLGHVVDEDQQALIVTRFDRDEGGGKLRLEDFAQLLLKPRGRDYTGKYDGAYEEVAASIEHHSVRPIIDLARYFQRLIIFAIVGNCDAHLKNFSLLETPQGLRLSPVYDVVNSGLYPGYTQSFALTLLGQRLPFEAIDSNHLRLFGERIGLNPTAVGRAFIAVKRGAQAAWRVVEEPAAPDEFRARFAEIVRSGCSRILE